MKTRLLRKARRIFKIEEHNGKYYVCESDVWSLTELNLLSIATQERRYEILSYCRSFKRSPKYPLKYYYWRALVMWFVFFGQFDKADPYIDKTFPLWYKELYRK